MKNLLLILSIVWSISVISLGASYLIEDDKFEASETRHIISHTLHEADEHIDNSDKAYFMDLWHNFNIMTFLLIITGLMLVSLSSWLLIKHKNQLTSTSNGTKTVG